MTGVQTCALPISEGNAAEAEHWADRVEDEMDRLELFSPRESLKSVSDGHPKGHRGLLSGVPVRVRTDRESGEARQVRGVQRRIRERPLWRCVNQSVELFDWPK